MYRANIAAAAATAGGRASFAALVRPRAAVFARHGDTFWRRIATASTVCHARMALARDRPALGKEVAATPRNIIRSYSAKSLPPNIVITMPALSPTMTQGNIGTWHKKIGDKISAGDVLVEIETDKAQMDFECQDEGYLAKILAETGTKDVPINRPIAVFVDEAADIAKVADFVPEEAEGAAPVPPKSKPTADLKQETQNVEAPSSVTNSAGSREASDRKIASPLAKVLAAQKGINLNEVDGSGPNGRVVKADIDQFAPSSKAKSAKAAAPDVIAAYTDVPLTNMRKVIAQRLTQSKQEVPHYYLTVEIEMDKILKLREVLNRDARNGAPKLSVNDFVVKASALALKAVPEANSAWNGDFVRQFHHADICVATATPGGLITPIVRNCEQIGLATISSRVRDLAARAREGKLAPRISGWQLYYLESRHVRRQPVHGDNQPSASLHSGGRCHE